MCERPKNVVNSRSRINEKKRKIGGKKWFRSEYLTSPNLLKQAFQNYRKIKTARRLPKLYRNDANPPIPGCWLPAIPDDTHQHGVPQTRSNGGNEGFQVYIIIFILVIVEHLAS